jgi:hypothetical protein
VTGNCRAVYDYSRNHYLFLWGEGLREEAGRALSDGRVAVAGWLLAGWEPVLLIDPGGDGKQEITKYFLTPLGVPLCDTTP